MDVFAHTYHLRAKPIGQVFALKYVPTMVVVSENCN